jgi:hypothetical protein
MTGDENTKTFFSRMWSSLMKQEMAQILIAPSSVPLSLKPNRKYSLKSNKSIGVNLVTKLDWRVCYKLEKGLNNNQTSCHFVNKIRQNELWKYCAKIFVVKSSIGSITTSQRRIGLFEMLPIVGACANQKKLISVIEFCDDNLKTILMWSCQII